MRILKNQYWITRVEREGFKNLQAAACQCESSNPEWI